MSEIVQLKEAEITIVAARLGAEGKAGLLLRGCAGSVMQDKEAQESAVHLSPTVKNVALLLSDLLRE